MTQATATRPSVEQATDKNVIRQFNVDVPEAELTELRRRILATKWPERETVADATQGVQLATMQALARYWATEYDWRKIEAKLNALPQFITEIDGLDIHFIHVRSKHENALPLIVTHGWPGSITEQLKIIDPLTNPTAHGGNASDAFHVVIPSMPGYGFSGRPTTTGWDPAHIARAWTVLMKRLGYTKFVAQGGDWGAIITELLGAQAPPELAGIHTNMPNAVPADLDKLAFSGGPAPANLPADEKLAYDRLGFVYAKGIAYGYQMGLRPQTLYGIADSPVGLAAYFLDHDARSYEMIARVFAGGSEGLTRDDVLDNITLTWLTNTAHLRRAALLGEQRCAILRCQRRDSPDRCKRLSRRTLSRSTELGGAGVSQTHPLQQAPQRRPLCGLGTTEALYRRVACGLQVAAIGIIRQGDGRCLTIRNSIIDYRTYPGCWTITFSNPPINMFVPETIVELGAIMTEIEGDPSLKVVVFQSANPEFFTAHLDVAKAVEKPGVLDLWREFVLRLSSAPVVSIAKIRGRTRGIGNEFVLACDMRFASRQNALFGNPEVGVGLIPGGGALEWLPRLVGRSRALEFVLSADDFDADIAERYGWVNRTLDDSDLGSFVDTLVRRLASFDRKTLATAKAQLNRFGTPTASELQSSNDMIFPMLAWPDAQARRGKLRDIGYGVRSDFELNFGRYLPGFGQADEAEMNAQPQRARAGR